MIFLLGYLKPDKSTSFLLTRKLNEQEKLYGAVGSPREVEDRELHYYFDKE